MSDLSNSISLSSAWQSVAEPAAAGFLAMQGVANPAFHPELEQEKRRIESELRSRFSVDGALDTFPVMQAYRAYYKRFKKSYHVKLQIDSIVSKGKSIPTASALVECMFMAELEHGLLTAGHDLDRIQLPVRGDVASGDERYILLRGEEQTLKPGDLYIADHLGILSSIIYGPDQRTQITSRTTNVLFTIYAPPGISFTAVFEHLHTLQKYVLCVAPAAQTLYLNVLGE